MLLASVASGLPYDVPGNEGRGNSNGLEPILCR